MPPPSLKPIVIAAAFTLLGLVVVLTGRALRLTG
jgi:hypothetical protein